jgi:hypothetical protein
MAIFNSYVKLPEGNMFFPFLSTCQKRARHHRCQAIALEAPKSGVGSTTCNGLCQDRGLWNQRFWWFDVICIYFYQPRIKKPWLTNCGGSGTEMVPPQLNSRSGFINPELTLFFYHTHSQINFMRSRALRLNFKFCLNEGDLKKQWSNGCCS